MNDSICWTEERRKQIVYLVDNKKKKDNINIIREDDTKLILHLITRLITNVKRLSNINKSQIIHFYKCQEYHNLSQQE